MLGGIALSHRRQQVLLLLVSATTVLFFTACFQKAESSSFSVEVISHRVSPDPDEIYDISAADGSDLVDSLQAPLSQDSSTGNSNHAWHAANPEKATQPESELADSDVSASGKFSYQVDEDVDIIGATADIMDLEPLFDIEADEEYVAHSSDFVGASGTMAVSREQRLLETNKIRSLKEALLDRPKEHEFEHVEWTSESLDRLAACLSEDTCGDGEQTVVILGSFHFQMAREGRVSGEDIWAASTLRALSALNITTLYLPFAPLVYLAHSYIPNLVSVILWEPEELRYCLNALDPEDDPAYSMKDCIKRVGFEEGIPIWKSLSFNWWERAMEPLGGKWTLNPEDLELGNRYLGYSVKETCSSHQFVPHQNRKYRAMLLGKKYFYFEDPLMAFPGQLQLVAERLSTSQYASSAGGNFEFVSAALPIPPDETPRKHSPGGIQAEAEHRKRSDEASATSIPNDERATFPEGGVSVIPINGQKQWYEELGGSKVLVGVGNPRLSPSRTCRLQV